MTDVVALGAELLAIQSPTGGEGKARRFRVAPARARGWNVTVQEVTPGAATSGRRAAAAASRCRRTSTRCRRTSRPDSTATRLYGRGACDAKGIAAAMLAAADRLAECGRGPRRPAARRRRGEGIRRRARREPPSGDEPLPRQRRAHREQARERREGLAARHGEDARHAKRIPRTRTSASPRSSRMLALLPTIRAAAAADRSVLGDTTVNIGDDPRRHRGEHRPGALRGRADVPARRRRRAGEGDVRASGQRDGPR